MEGPVRQRHTVFPMPSPHFPCLLRPSLPPPSDSRELPVIGEIQIHDRQLFDFKHRLHRLYTVVRASSIDQI